MGSSSSLEAAAAVACGEGSGLLKEHTHTHAQAATDNKHNCIYEGFSPGTNSKQRWKEGVTTLYFLFPAFVFSILLQFYFFHPFLLNISI